MCVGALQEDVLACLVGLQAPGTRAAGTELPALSHLWHSLARQEQRVFLARFVLGGWVAYHVHLCGKNTWSTNADQTRYVLCTRSLPAC